MNSPKITVVIPMYNKAPHVKRSINSVLAQTYDNFELIIVNDASTDGSSSIAEKLIKDVDNAIMINRDKPGPGGYAARNLGIENARGEWIAFLDADDEWFPDILKEFNRVINDYSDCSFVGTAYKRVAPNGTCSLDPYSRNHKEKDVRVFNLLEYAYVGSLGQNPVSAITVCIRKHLLKSIGGFPQNRCVRGGDRDTWLRLFMKENLYWTPYIGAVYYRDAVNMVTKNTPGTLSQCKDQTFRSIIKDKELKRKYGAVLSRTIKKQSNFEKKSIYKRLIYHGELSLRDLKYLYFFQDIIFYIVVFGFALLPGVCQKKIIRLLFFKGGK